MYMKGWTHLAMSMFAKDRGTGDHKSILRICVFVEKHKRTLTTSTAIFCH